MPIRIARQWIIHHCGISGIQQATRMSKLNAKDKEQEAFKIAATLDEDNYQLSRRKYLASQI